jgi:hypothetical protein
MRSTLRMRIFPVTTITYRALLRRRSDYERRKNQQLTGGTLSVMSLRSKKRASVALAGLRRTSHGGPCGNRTASGRRWESADKPGSVLGNHSSGMHVAVHLERPTRERARAARCRSERTPADPFPYLALLRAGFAVPCLLPGPRCALTAPFHPCQPQANLWLRRFAFCCTFRGLAPPRRYLAPCPMEPGLSSRGRAASGCLADSHPHDRAPGPEAQAPCAALSRPARA